MYRVENGIIRNKDGKVISDRKEVAKLLCKTANGCLHIKELWSWKEISDEWNFTIDEFFDDVMVGSGNYFDSGYNWEFTGLEGE